MEDQKGIKKRFETLVKNTYCPFASFTKVWCAPSWSRTEKAEINIKKAILSFHKFVLKGIYQGYDIFVMEVREEAFIRGIDSWATLLNKVLYEIHLTDVQKKEYFTVGIEKMEWDFVFAGVRFFIPTFTPFYDQSHSRYSFNRNAAFIVFQPDSTFDKFNINSKNPNRDKITQAIRLNFLEHGVDYDVKLVKDSLKALRYIKPLEVGSPLVKWWLFDELTK